MVASAFTDQAENVVVLHLMKYAIFVPVGVVVYFVCCLMWIGFDAPMHLSALRLAAAFAVVDTLAIPFALFGFIGLGMLVISLGLLLHNLMDLEVQDALILAVVLIVVQVIVAIAISQAMQGG